MKLIVAILIFSIIILFHELGHFLLAKANGIRVNEFSLGLGPTLFGIKKGETTYSLKLLPMGGACMMEGEDEESGDNRAFGNKSVWARISVVVAGPFFNFIMAFVFAFILLSNIGYDAPVLSGVKSGYAAEDAGMQAGDKIIRINRSKIHFFRDISLYTQTHPGDAVVITYERDGVRYQTELTPQYSEEMGGYLYGFLGPTERTQGTVFENLRYSVHEVSYWIRQTLAGLKSIVTGSISVNELSGPVGIVGMIGDSYEQSIAHGYKAAFLQLLYLTILLSANLGVMNLLPLPALDGGRLLFMLVELVRGKRVSPEKEGMVHLAGMLLLFGLMLIVMFNDIRRILI
ncbi:MAG: RIP metalloprotease RseP [Clostridiales bacterium]|nr:RIP metalloprotease RseP [Clostridiales bacterium]